MEYGFSKVPDAVQKGMLVNIINALPPFLTGSNPVLRLPLSYGYKLRKRFLKMLLLCCKSSKYGNALPENGYRCFTEKPRAYASGFLCRRLKFFAAELYWQ